MRRLGVLLVTLLLVLSGQAAAPPAPRRARCRRTSRCRRGVRQLLTVTSDRWSDTRATLNAWERTTPAGTACAGR